MNICLSPPGGQLLLNPETFNSVSIFTLKFSVEALCCLVYKDFNTHYTKVMIRDANAYQIPQEQPFDYCTSSWIFF